MARVKPPDRVLLPLDIHKCPIEAFSCVNQIAGPRATVTLLHVINLNVLAPDGRVFDELCSAGEKGLNRLSDKFLSPRFSVRHQVRFGTPCQEILGEAGESGADLIVLTTHGRGSFWKRPFHPRTIQRVLRSARCDVMLLHVKTRFDCNDDWLYANEVVLTRHSGASQHLPSEFKTKALL